MQTVPATVTLNLINSQLISGFSATAAFVAAKVLYKSARTVIIIFMHSYSAIDVTNVHVVCM